MSRVEVAESVVWLRAKLAGGPRRRNELETEAHGAGLPWATVESAKAKLGLVVTVQHGPKRSPGRSPLSWATKQQCDELNLELWRPGASVESRKKRAPTTFHQYALQESLRARGQRVMDESHGE
jgi:hypothetical protein